MAKTPSSYTSVRDRFDGGGKGKSGPTFSGGPLSKVANAIGIKPLAARAAMPSGGGGGADSGRAAARVAAQRAAGLAARNYKGNSDNSSGNGESPLTKIVADKAAATAAPVNTMKRTYVGPPPAGYNPAKQGEWSYFKSESVNAPVSPMKKGGKVRSSDSKPAKATTKVRGCGCATRGTKGGKMV